MINKPPRHKKKTEYNKQDIKEYIKNNNKRKEKEKEKNIRNIIYNKEH